MNPADQRWWRDQENSGALVCQHGLESPAGSPQLPSHATPAVAVAAAVDVVATAVLTVVVADTVAGEAEGGGRVTVPTGHETQCGPDDS